MITSRFNKDEAVIQRDYMTSKLKKRRILLFIAEFFAMAILFALLVIAATPYRSSPLFVPLFPPALAFFIFGAVFLATGMYFRKRLWDLADPQTRRPLLSRFTRLGMVWIVVFVIVLLIFLPMSPLVPGTNYAESLMAKEGNATVGAITHIRLEFQGADSLGTVRAEVTVRSTNNVTLDFYLMYKSDAGRLDPELSQLDDFAIKKLAHDTHFEYKQQDLDASQYTIVIVNTNNETANIHFLVFDHTSDMLSLMFVLFFIVYIAIAGGWLFFVVTLGKRAEAPLPLPPAPVPSPVQLERPTVQRGLAASASAAAEGAYARQAPAVEAAPAPVTGGTRMTITCPRCATTFDVVRGPGRTRIKCPNCGKEGTLAGLPMPAPVPEEEAPPPAPEAPAYLAAPEPPALPPEPRVPQRIEAPAPEEIPEAPTLPVVPVTPVTPPPKRNISCPRCKNVFPIDKVEGPQHIKCPHCGKEGTIGIRRAPAAAPAPAVPPPPSPAPRPPAPAPAQYPAPGTRPPAPEPRPPAPPKMISCPQCKKPFPVAETRRPLQVKCPNCGKEGVLRK